MGRVAPADVTAAPHLPGRRSAGEHGLRHENNLRSAGPASEVGGVVRLCQGHGGNLPDPRRGCRVAACRRRQCSSRLTPTDTVLPCATRPGDCTFSLVPGSGKTTFLMDSFSKEHPEVHILDDYQTNPIDDQSDPLWSRNRSTAIAALSRVRSVIVRGFAIATKTLGRCPEVGQGSRPEEVGKVVDGGKNIGYEYCCGVLFQNSGQNCYYRTQDVQRCDEDGNTRPPAETVSACSWCPGNCGPQAAVVRPRMSQVSLSWHLITRTRGAARLGVQASASGIAVSRCAVSSPMMGPRQPKCTVTRASVL